MRNNKSYSISAQRASPLAGAHFRGTAREKTALLQSLLNLRYESQSAPPRRLHRPRNSTTNPAPASIPATSALAPGDGDGRAAVTSGSGGGRCGGDVRQRRRRQAAAATSGSGGDRCDARGLLHLEVFGPRLHKILVFRYKGGKVGNGILPAPLTAPPANGATSTLAPAVAGRRRSARQRSRANSVDRRATRGLLHGRISG